MSAETRAAASPRGISSRPWSRWLLPSVLSGGFTAWKRDVNTAMHANTIHISLRGSGQGERAFLFPL